MKKFARENKSKGAIPRNKVISNSAYYGNLMRQG